MQLKHDWSPEQSTILLALKKQLAEKKTCCVCGGPVKIQQGMMIMMKHLDMPFDLPLIWEKTFKRESSKNYSYAELLIGQAAATLFTTPSTPLISGPAVDAAAKCFCWSPSPYQSEHKYIPGCDLPCEFIAPAKEGNTAKLTFLLDVAVDRLKACEELAIFLLNEKKYALVMTLDGVKEHLCRIPQRYLREHWLKLNPATGEEKAFLRYVFPLLENKSDLIESITLNARLHRRINDLLEFGFSPDDLLFDRTVLKITLRQYIYFLDEISEEIKNANFFNCLGNMRKNLAAIPKFMKFIQEKENK